MATIRKVSYVLINWDLLASYYPDSGTLNLNHLTETSITNLKSVDIVSPVNITLTFNDNTTIVCRVDSYGYLVATGYNFGKTLLVKGISYMDEELDVLKEHNAVTMGGVKIYFYTRTGKKNVVNKSTLLSNEEIILGDFTESFNVSELSLTLDYPIDVFNWTYCYIPQLKRYYFITGKESISKHFIRISLDVDVLYSFKSLILSQTNVMINRNETNYNGVLEDKKFPLENKQTIEYTNCDFGGTIPVSGNVFNPDSDYSVVLTGACVQANREGYNNVNTHTIVNEIFGSSPDMKSFHALKYGVRDKLSYVLSNEQFYNLTKKLFRESSDEVLSFISSIVVFPFKIPDYEIYDWGADSPANPPYVIHDHKIIFQLGNYYIDVEQSGTEQPMYCKTTFYENSSRWFYMDKTINKKFSGQLDFLNYNPYSRYELYLPYVGWVELNANDILGKRIQVWYTANYLSGSGEVSIYNYTDKKFIYNNDVQLGIKLEIHSTNEQSLRQQQTTNAINTSMGVLASVIKGVASGVSGNYAGAVMSGVAGVGTLVAGIDQSNAIRTMHRANLGSISNPNNGIYNYQFCILKHSYMKPIKSTNTYL